MSQPQYLFVYGTLRSAFDTEAGRFLRSASTWVGRGRMRGLLFQFDGYPGMTTTATEDARVVGELYLLNESGPVWQVLDPYEGSAYERRIVDVLLDDGQTIPAWVYVYCLETKGRPRIDSGDYTQSRSS